MKKVVLVIMLIALTCSVWAMAARERDDIIFVGGAYGAMTEKVESDTLGEYSHSKSGAGFVIGAYDPIGGSEKWAGLIKTAILFPSSYSVDDIEIDLEDYERNLMLTADYGVLYTLLSSESAKLSIGPTLRLNVHTLSADLFSDFNFNAGLGAYLLGMYKFNDSVNINAGLSASYSPFLWSSRTTKSTGTLDDTLFVNNFAIEPMIAIGFQM